VRITAAVRFVTRPCKKSADTSKNVMRLPGSCAKVRARREACRAKSLFRGVAAVAGRQRVVNSVVDRYSDKSRLTGRL
jgi:hypothetical protein